MSQLIIPNPHHNHHDYGNDGNSNVAKTVAMICLFTASFVLGTVPIKLNKWFKWESNAKNNKYVKLLLCFGGGVLFCTTFMHMLPEVAEGFEALEINSSGYEIHYAELLMCVGFFTMYFVEELIHQWLNNREELTAIRRSFLVRNGEAFDFTVEKPHHHEHNRGHSHFVMPSADKTVRTVRGLLIVLALSIHELFEGLAVGLESSAGTVWYMFGAVSAHKFVIAFCIGVELVTSGLKNLLVITYVFTFAVVSPMGIGIGMIITNCNQSSSGTASVFLQGLASGTLLYVVFFEVLQAERKSGIRHFFAVFTGFILMGAITIFV